MYSFFNIPGKKQLLFACIAICAIILPAQYTHAQTKASIKITGKVIDDKKKGLEAATAVLTAIRNMGGKTDTVFISGISDKNGQFAMKVDKGSLLSLKISAVGFEVYTQELGTANADINAGNITLLPEAKSLGNVVVTAKKAAMQLGVDRRIFNAEAAITAKGGTAVDLMKNIPSLSVDVNGGVQLRNSSPVIFVDGRPTILTLEQIPADDIEKVELITNPSAKYDAASTGGIINIVLKKNRKNGMNGLATIGGGIPHQLNGGLSLNLRQNKLNFFVSGNYNKSGGVGKSETYRENKKDGVVTDFFTQTGETERGRSFANVRFGVDYFIDQYNTISVSQAFVKGRFNNPETQNQQYYDAAGNLTQTGERTNIDKWGFTRSNTQVNYRRSYERTGKEWTADFTYSSGPGDGFQTITNQLYLPDGSIAGPSTLVHNYSLSDEDQYTFQTDYVNPITENSKLELGARGFISKSSSKLDAFSMDGGLGTKLPLSNNYAFRQSIFAVYGNYNNAIGKLKYQGGLRLEQSSFKGELIDSAQTFGYDYPSKKSGIWSLFFPSVFLTYQLKEGHDLQANFSRRIRRPNFWQVEPYVDISDPQNLRKGNPELQPEFTNSFEFNYNYQKGGSNLLVSLFFKNNTGDITEFSDTITAEVLQQLNNAAVSPNAILTTFVNANRTNRSGIEITWQQKLGTNFDFTPSFSAMYRDMKANLGGQDFSNSGFNWNAKLMGNYKIVSKSKLFNNLAFQLMGQYESPRVTPQGKTKEQHSIDFGMKKDFLKNNVGTLTLNIQDVFNTRRFGSITDTEYFYQDSYRRWNVRSFRLTFSYRFGNKDLEIFKKKEGRGDEES